MGKSKILNMYCPHCAKEKLALPLGETQTCPGCSSSVRYDSDSAVTVIGSAGIVIGTIDPKSHWLKLLTPRAKR